MLCPNCGSIELTTESVEDNFLFGADPASQVQLTAIVPLHTCNSCEFQFTDSAAENLRHEAVCKHLGVLSPTDIRGIRADAGLTRKEFAEFSKIGEASLARWETGELIQSAAYDQYLKLLVYKENIERIQSNFAKVQAEVPALNLANIGQLIKTRALQINDKRAEACAFDLARPATT